jgi:hypothetical protein
MRVAFGHKLQLTVLCCAVLCAACLQDIDPLSTLPRLTTLSIAGNPVALKKEYRCGSISFSYF